MDTKFQVGRGKSAAVGMFAAAVFFSGCWTAPSGDKRVGENNGGDDYSRATKMTNSKSNVNRDSGNSNSNANQERRGPVGFTANLPVKFEMPSDSVGQKLLKEYGSVFVARGGATPPNKVVFRDESEVLALQSTLKTERESIGGFQMELQAAAMAALKNAIKEAEKNNLRITPRAADSSRRTYGETVGLWESRVEPALKHWVGKGRMKQADADRIKTMPPFEQVSEVLKLEETGIYFAKDLSKSIIYSVAPPGTSQHLSMLAFDVNEHENQEIRRILSNHGWYQTVASDLPHFTFLGVAENALPDLGLKRMVQADRVFWVPDI